jgi:hypothetical protein
MLAGVRSKFHNILGSALLDPQQVTDKRNLQYKAAAHL